LPEVLRVAIATWSPTWVDLSLLLVAYSSSKSANAHLRTENTRHALDLPHIPEPTRSEMTKELELRLQQLRMLLQTFHTE
jgi:hypothetical protein